MYVVYTSPRDLPGTASGNGKDVPWEDGYWLGEAADEGEGQYIPTKIAAALKGRTFNNFAEFKSAFWDEVSKDPELMSQFGMVNKGQIRKGNAPFSLPDTRWGNLRRYSLHHVIKIKDGGDVYNIDNIRVVTPGLHWGEIHGSKRIGKKGNIK